MSKYLLFPQSLVILIKGLLHLYYLLIFKDPDSIPQNRTHAQRHSGPSLAYQAWKNHFQGCCGMKVSGTFLINEQMYSPESQGKEVQAILLKAFTLHFWEEES